MEKKVRQTSGEITVWESLPNSIYYVAGCDPYKEDAPIVIYEQMDDKYIQPYDKQSIVDKVKEAQEEYNKVLNRLNEESPQ